MIPMPGLGGPRPFGGARKGLPAGAMPMPGFGMLGLGALKKKGTVSQIFDIARICSPVHVSSNGKSFWLFFFCHVCLLSISALMGRVHVTSWYPNFSGSHFGLPPSEIHRMTGLPPKIVWTMTYSPGPIPLSHPALLNTQRTQVSKRPLLVVVWKFEQFVWVSFACSPFCTAPALGTHCHP